MTEKSFNPKFPRRFFWGAATSAHQVEGNNHNQWTVFELENAKTRSVQAEYFMGDFVSWPNIKNEAMSPANYVSGKLGDHYNNYKKDFDYLEKLNMNAFRFSVEWSRVEPKEGMFDSSVIEHYKKCYPNLNFFFCILTHSNELIKENPDFYNLETLFNKIKDEN